MSGAGFVSELEHLLNRYSQENGSDTPDFILAKYLNDCLTVWNHSIAAREKWYGRMPSWDNLHDESVPPVINDVEQTQALNREINRQMSVPPARPVATGRLSQSGTTANTDMAKVTNRPPVPPEVEREAWLDGRARVKPEKEKP